MVVCESVPTRVSGKASSLDRSTWLDHDHIGQILQVDLVDDAGHRWHNPEVVEGLLAPFQKLVAFAVALELDLGVPRQGVRRGKEIHLNGVIDDQIDGDERVDPLRIAAEAIDGGAHGCQIHDGRDAGEVLHDDAGGQERNAGRVTPRRPGGEYVEHRRG